MRAKIDLFGGGKDEKRTIHYSELRTPLEAREEDIFKPKDEQPISPIGPIGPMSQTAPAEQVTPEQISPIGPIEQTSPTDSLETTPIAAPAPELLENQAPSPLTPPPAKKSPWTFKWFGSQAPARDEQKEVPESKAVGATSFEEKKGGEPTEPISPISPISPMGQVDPTKSTNYNDEPKTPTVEGNIVDLSKLKK